MMIPIFVLMSALQKAVRRCETNEARYFAQEFIEMGKPGGVFKRLTVIAAEDIGLADPTFLKYVRDCWNTFETMLKERNIRKSKVSGSPELRAVIDQAVIAAALCYKSRLLPMLSFAILFDIFKNEDLSQDSSEHANRFRTAIKRRNEKEAAYYGYMLGLFLNADDSLFEIIQQESKTRNTTLIDEWTHEYKRTKKRTEGKGILMLAGIVSLLCRDLNYPHGEYRDQVAHWLSKPIEKATIPDRAYDKHTSPGRKKGRGLEHFLTEGATVVNERFPSNWEELGREAYFQADKVGLAKSAKLIQAIKEKLWKISHKETP